MRILIITALYHPSKSPNVYRWSAIAEYWVEQGHEVHILCTTLAGEPMNSEQKGVVIHRAGHHTLMDWALSILGKKQSRGKVGGLKSQAHSPLRKFAEWFINQTWRRFYWPDGAMLWYRPAKRKLQSLLQAQRFDAIISVGLPFTAHRIALTGKQKQPHLNWLVDIEDPFAISEAFFVNNFKLYRGRNFRAEACILAKADVISFTVLAAQQAYETHFPESKHKFIVTPPLFNLNPPPVTPSNHPFIHSSHNHPFTPSHLHLSYFGTFYHQVRTPDAFLQLLDESLKLSPALRAKLRVHFFGEISGPFAESFQQYPRLAPNLQLHGLISRSEVAIAMEQTDVLLNISNTTTYHLPSKSADYLMSQKPIVNIYSAEADTFKAFFKDYPLIQHIRLLSAKDATKSATPFIQFLHDTSGQKVPASIVEELGQAYRLPNIAAQYFKHLSQK